MARHQKRSHLKRLAIESNHGPSPGKIQPRTLGEKVAGASRPDEGCGAVLLIVWSGEELCAMADGGKRPVCAVVGVGPGNGEALARRFAANGYSIALMARRTELTAKLARELTSAKSYACDVTEAASVEAAFAATRSDLGDVDALIYNAGSGVWGHVEEVKPEDLERSWRVNTLGLFLSGQQAIPAMRRKGGGAIIVVGATASRRGAAGAAAFAQSKMAQRALAESMARHLWPAGIHVALIVVDGVVGGPVTRSRVGNRPDDFFIDPAGVAVIAADLVKQDRAAWSFEVEARPFKEKW
jgi:NAD(P)-dependent dehydrogenase (short-subunit alcohol dehydrogenase family)